MNLETQIALEQEILQDALRVENLFNTAEKLQTISAAMAEYENLSPEGALYAYKAANIDCQSLGIEPPVFPNQLAFESFSPRIQTQLALESISGKIREILEMIRRLIARMIEKLKQLWQSFNAEVTRLKFHLDQLRTKLAEHEGRSAPHGNVLLGMAVYGIAVERKIPADSYTMVKNLGLVTRTLNGIRTEYVPVVMSIGDRLSKALPEWNKEDPELWLTNLNNISADYRVSNFARLVGASFSFMDARYPIGSAVTTPTLPGNRRLVFVDGAKTSMGGGTDSVSQASRILGSSVQLIRLQIGDLDTSFGSEMQILPPSYIGDILDAVGELIDEIEEGVKGRLSLQISELAKKVNEASKRLEGVVTESGPLVQAGLRHASTFLSWTESPYTGLLSHAMSVCRSHLSVASKHIKAY